MRRLWFLEEISRPPRGLSVENPAKAHARFTALNQADSLLAHASGGASLGYLDFQLDAGQIYFGMADFKDSVDSKTYLRGEMTFFGGEISRYFVDTRNFYGRVSLKFIIFEPLSLWTWRPGLQTGVHATPSQPWDLEFRLGAMFYFVHVSDSLFASLRSGRTFYFGAGEKQSLQVSATFTFGKKLRVLPGESLLFSIGPSAVYSTEDWGQFSLGIPFRIWIDTATLPSGAAGLISAFDPPALQAAWTLNW